MQKNFLNQNALPGKYNPVYAKFFAVNMTDMRDKIEENITVHTFESMKKAKEKYKMNKKASNPRTERKEESKKVIENRGKSDRK